MMPKTSKSGSNAHQNNFLRLEIAPSTMVLLVVGVAGLWMLGKMLPVLCVLAFALFLVSALNSAVKFLEDHGMNRLTSIALVFFLMLLATALIIVLAVRPLSDELSLLSEQIPVLRTQ